MSKAKKIEFKWLIIICFFFTSSIISSQSSKYNIRNIKTKEGLPQNSVKNIQFDKAGYCWIGTEMGLVRYDGKNFKVFDRSNIPGLDLERIRNISKDDNGEIYIQNSNAQRLKIYVSDKGQASVPKIISNSEIWLPLRGGKAINSSFLSNWSDSLYRITQYLWISNTGVITKDKDVYIIQRDRVNFIKNETFIRIDSFDYLVDNVKQMVVGNIFFQKYPDQSLKAWLKGTPLTHIKKIHGPLENNELYRKGIYKSMIESHETYIYAGTKLYKLFYHDGILDSKVLLEDLEIPAISTVYYNRVNDTYYIGSYVAGLYIVSPSYFRYGQIPPESLERSFYSSVLTHDGDVFCQGTLFHKDGSYTQLPITRFLGAALYLSPEQELYYGGDPVLHRYNMITGKEVKLATLDNRLSWISANKFDSSDINFFTASYYYRYKNNSISERKKVPSRAKREDIVNAIQTGRDSFLLATQSGLKWYDSKNNIVYRSILPGKLLRNIYAEGIDRVWCSTYGQGYFLYEKGRVIRLPNDEFPALKTIHSFIDDGRGYFWLPTNNGLFKVKKSDLLDYAQDTTREVFFYEFNTIDNLKTNEFNGGCAPSYLWLKDSVLSLPSLEGLVQFSPFKIKTVMPTNKIYVSDIKLDGKTLDYPVYSKIYLEPGFRKLTIALSSPFFGNSENLRLRYKIEGLYEEWQAVPENGEVQLNRIPSGTYKLVVTKLKGFDKQDVDYFELEVNVAPWFYFTWWFILLFILFMSFLVFLLIKYRIKVLKDNNQKLEDLVDSQTKDLSDTVKRLARSQTELMASNDMKDRVTTMVLHDLRSPIRFLHLMTNQLSKGFQKYTPEVMVQRMASLKSSTAALNQFTEQFFAWAASQHTDFKTNYTMVNLDDIFNDIKDLYSDIVNVNGNILTYQLTNIKLYTDRNILSVVLRNLVDNANNSTNGGSISMSAEVQKELLIVTIKDSGKGFSDEELSAFSEQNNATSTGGHGSMIVSSLLEKINGKLSIESVKNKGTAFKVQLTNYHTH